MKWLLLLMVFCFSHAAHSQDAAHRQDGSTGCPAPLPYSITSGFSYYPFPPPSQNFDIAVMGIRIFKPKGKSRGIKKHELRELATLAHRNLQITKRFDSTIIIAFGSSDYARQFARYQQKRRLAPLTEVDYSALVPVWKGALICGVFTQKKTYFLYPQNNPRSWWRAR